jgi:hypothetical protein
VDVPVSRIKLQKQEFRVPHHPHLCFPLPVRILPLPVRAEAHWRSRSPSSLHRPSLAVHRASQLHCKRCVRPEVSHISAFDIRTTRHRSRSACPFDYA